jgi:hypothetical protein
VRAQPAVGAGADDVDNLIAAYLHGGLSLRVMLSN